jgi:phenylalanyl-tRNA synthetase beta chain
VVRVSLRWLEEYVTVDVPVEKLVELLDMSGTKVEAVLKPERSIGGVSVAEVVKIDPHPDAEKLTLVEVKTSEDDSQTVVCGASNFSVGDKVPLANVGATLPEMEVSERRIRGVVSKGMLCSAAELGVSEDHSGILVLASDASLGDDVVKVLGLDDTTLELEITPNRPDCMSMVGVAREVAALLSNELKVPDPSLTASEEVASPVEVDIDDTRGCPRYLARYIEGVQVGSSPSWMASRLVRAGMRPISNVVDVTNYVLLELGHPLHAFDAARVHKQHIVVRRAKRGERLSTLDERERLLHEDDLLIADARKALAIAGVIGGTDSEVSDDTTDVILESAYFDPASIAFTARRHIVRTEASARFERGMDPEMVPVAAARAAQLMSEIAGGAVAARETDVYPAPVERPRLTLRPDRTTSVLGTSIGAESQVALLRSIQVDARPADGVIEVDVPSFRPDLKREEDLIEEVARLAGFEHLPSTLPPGKLGGLERDQAAERHIRRVLVGLGLYEAWTSSFMSPRDLDALEVEGHRPATPLARLANPVSEDESCLRTTLLPGLLRSAARNLAHHVAGAALFEIARVYEPSDATLPREALVLGAVFAGSRRRQSWRGDATPWDFFAVKGIVEAMFASLGLSPPSFAAATGAPFHPTRAATLGSHQATLGAMGEIHPRVCERWNVPEGTVAFEIALAPVLAALPERAKVAELPRFPGVYLDLAVVVNESVRADEISSIIEESGAPEVVDVRLFDLYRGEQVPAGKKSLAYALELRVADRTLTDAEAAEVRDRIVKVLSERTGAALR